MSSKVVATTIITEDTERLDRATKRIYGSEQDGTVEQLLDANPGLAGLAKSTNGALIFGTVVAVTERVDPKPAAFTRPWE